MRDPIKGFSYFTFYTFLLAANNYAQLGLFANAPLISTIQLTFIRGVICALIVVVMLILRGQSVKGKLIDSVDRQSLKPLILRATQSAVCVYIAFMSIKYFNVSTVGIVCSIKPVFVCLVAVMLCGERMGAFDVLSNAVSLLAVLLVIIGTPAESSET